MSVGLIGRGRWGTNIIKKINKLNYKVITIKRSDNLLKIIKNLNEIFIVTNDETHFKFLKQLKSQKKRLYCEKPLSRKISEITKIQRANFDNLYVSDLPSYYSKFKIKKKNFFYRSKIDKKSFLKVKRYDLLYRFAYHDLGYIYKRLGNLDINSLKVINSVNNLEFEFNIKKYYFNFRYYTDKKKKYTFNNNSFYSKKDYLKIMIKDFLGKKVNTKLSLKKSIKISKILELIRIRMMRSQK